MKSGLEYQAVIVGIKSVTWSIQYHISLKLEQTELQTQCMSLDIYDFNPYQATTGKN